ncbi:hypothetical protein Vadar_012927 [Vaccinium darrowii]|uniref:Uncharacterized protein n=1 Tax=Vaccinium darrowii TaxID=229202 RepID=A0ACB7XIC7_9ERIC|nr:hypothetical protein Vadar_012927 [Vaccinium darrowii]
MAQVAIVRTKPGPNKFNGAGAALSIHNPLVSEAQYSESRFVLQNGNDAIRAGWRAGQSHCFNTRCPGFVVVRSDEFLDFAYPDISRPGGPVYEAPLFLDRDLVNGNWWLLVGSDNIEVGFWPNRIFSGLADSASYVEWGGQVSGPPGPSPQMGTGSNRLQESTRYDAYQGNIAVLNEKGQTVDAYNTETFTDKPTVYGVEEVKHTKLGHIVLFTGPASYN